MEGQPKTSRPTIRPATPRPSIRRMAGTLRTVPNVVQHQPGAITFVSGTKLGTVRNVPAIRRIEGRGVAGRIVGRDVFGCPSIHRNDPQVVVSRGCFEFVVIRDVAEFL